MKGIAPGLRAATTGTHPVAPLALLFAVDALDELDGLAFAVLLPEIRDAFDLSLAEVGAIAAAGLPAAAAAGLLLAWLGDRTARTRLAAVGIMAWAVFSGITGLAWAVPVLVIARLGSELGRASEATHVSLLSDWYPTDLRARVLYAYGYADPMAYLLGPVAVGALAAVGSWRLPFLAIAVPAVVVGFALLRLPEPVRGRHERRRAGAAADVAGVEERSPTFGETYRVLATYRSVRWFWWSQPFFAAGSIGFSLLLPALLDEELGLGAAGRGLFLTMVAPGTLAGLVLGGRRIDARIAADPASAVRLLAGLMQASVAGAVVVVVAPNAAVAIVGALLVGACSGAVVPGTATLGSLVVPPRMRTLGLALGALWGLVGLLALPFIGALADRHGVRVGMSAFLPLFVVGGTLLTRAATSVRQDIDRTQAAARHGAERRHARLAGDHRLLAVRDLGVAFDGATVLSGVDLDVDDGELVAVVGTNGAGKSTLLRALAGAVVPDRGTVVFDGHEVTGCEPERLAQLGVCLVAGSSVLPELTVGENLRIAGWVHRRRPAAHAEAVEQALSLFPSLRARLDAPVGDLSGGEQQMVALSAAVVARPRLLLVDELTLGLAPAVTDVLVAAIRRLHAGGTTVLIVEQSARLALSLASRAVFLDGGVVRYDGPSSGLARRADLLRPVFLGADGNGRAPTEPRVVGQPALRARGLAKSFGPVGAVNDVDLDIAGGEVVAVVGPNGAGKTTLLDLLSGALQPDRGVIELAGERIETLTAAARARRGLGRSFQHARSWPTLTVAEAFAVARERWVREPSGLLGALRTPEAVRSEQEVSAAVDRLLDRLGLVDQRDTLVGRLSTGQRRLVELGCVLAVEPTVVLLDEPSAGLAHAEVEALADLVRAVRREVGCAVMLVSHDLGLVRAVSDRVVVLSSGSVLASGAPDATLRRRDVVSVLGTPPVARRPRPLRAALVASSPTAS